MSRPRGRHGAGSGHQSINLPSQQPHDCPQDHRMNAGSKLPKWNSANGGPRWSRNREWPEVAFFESTGRFPHSRDYTCNPTPSRRQWPSSCRLIGRRLGWRFENSLGWDRVMVLIRRVQKEDNLDGRERQVAAHLPPWTSVSGREAEDGQEKWKEVCAGEFPFVGGARRRLNFRSNSTLGPFPTNSQQS